MHLISYFSAIGALFSTTFAYTINWKGSEPRCELSHGRIQDIHDIVNSQMSEKALFSQGQTIACSRLGTNGVSGPEYWGYCAWVGNGGGIPFNQAKILSMLGYLLQAPNAEKSCGSVPIDYPLLNDSNNALTVNYVYNIPCNGVCVNEQDPQGTLPNNDRGYAPGTCRVNQFHAIPELH